MHSGTHISEQDLLSEIQQATLDVVETSAHVARRLREAKLNLDAPPIGEAAPTPPA